MESDENHLLTCFLEYRDEKTVMVHDLLHTRTYGQWSMRASSYPKLRIGAEWLSARCRAVGLESAHAAAGPRGMHVLHARRP